MKMVRVPVNGVPIYVAGLARARESGRAYPLGLARPLELVLFGRSSPSAYFFAFFTFFVFFAGAFACLMAAWAAARRATGTR